MNKKYDKTELARDFFDKGVMLQQSGHLDRAAHFYKRSIDFQPTARAHTFLGWIYSLKGFYNKAIDECRKAIELDPDYGNPYNDIGAYLLQLHKYDEAKDWLARALAAPNYKNYCYPNLNLGKIYEFKGQWETALTFYKRALKENKEYEPAINAITDLQAKYN